MLIWLNVI